jgi:RNA polymerase sigma-70 factor (ECF subfamily)
LAWLRQILAHRLADQMRRYLRGKRRIDLEVSLESELEQSSVRLKRWLGGGNSPSANVVREEQLLSLATALAKLSNDQKMAVEFRYLKGYGVTEVAANMGRTRAAVAGLLRRGLENLRNHLQQREL